jgi:hypothetical protein
MLTDSAQPEQFTEFYYNQFDLDRKQLAPLYVSFSLFCNAGYC